jgi:hypothetical protein
VPSSKNYTIATATTVSVDAKTTINASATGRGNGGKVVLRSDSETTFAGTDPPGKLSTISDASSSSVAA